MDLKYPFGMRVLVPFGSRKIPEAGYVVGIKETSEYQCKSIIKVIDTVFDKEKLNLAKWISKKYFCTLADSLRLLVPPGTSTVVNRVKTKTESVICLSPDYHEETLKNDKQKRVIRFLKDNQSVSKKLLQEFLGVSDSVLKTLEKNGQIIFQKEEISRNPLFHKNLKKTNPLVLTEEQRHTFESIDIKGYHKYLIHGVTGSGKTEVYLQLIEKVLDSGKNALVLVPEISLTPQMTDRFLSRFGNVVAILHSGLSLRRKV